MGWGTLPRIAPGRPPARGASRPAAGGPAPGRAPPPPGEPAGQRRATGHRSRLTPAGGRGGGLSALGAPPRSGDTRPAMAPVPPARHLLRAKDLIDARY